MNKKDKHIPVTRIIVIALIVLIVVAAVFFIFRFRDRKDNYLAGDFETGSNENVELLNKLNSEWTIPEGYELEIIEFEELTMEWIQAKSEAPEKVILQLHGGAYTRSLEDNGITYRRAAVQYAEISGAGVLTVDYRVAPENPYPAALEDALSAYNWLLAEGYSSDEIIIAGDSAGGGLTLATALYLRDHKMPMPAALITMSAWTDLDYRRKKISYVGDNNAKDPYISPIYGQYNDFPPMLMQVGGDEPLKKDTTKVAEKAQNAGVKLQQTTYKGMFHVFQMLFPELEDANAAWSEVDAFIDNIWE